MNIIGENIEPFVSEQINVRQQIYGSINRTPEQLQYLNSRNAFIKLVSSVDIISPNDFIRQDPNSELYNVVKNYPGNNLARRFVLYNGVTDTISNINKAGLPDSDSLINNSAYGLGGLTFGYRPMPGIVSADIKSENRGSLKTATLKIKAWNRPQFEIVDLLYLRLGYTILLEWGNTIYFTKKDVLYKEEPLSIANDFLNNISLNYDQVLDKIRENRKISKGNYDALYGKIVNYEWNFAEDGSYDITLIIRSIGDVIESLKINILYGVSGFSQAISNDSESSSNGFSIVDYANKHLIGTLFFRSMVTFNAKNIAVDRSLKTTQGNYSLLAEFLNLNENSITEKPGKYDNSQALLINGKAQFIKYQFNGGSSVVNAQYYIRFGYLLEFLQERILPYYQKSDNNLPFLKIDTADDNLAYFNYLQIGSDPRVCTINTKIKTSIENNYRFYCSAGEEYVDSTYKAGKIMNIYFNYQYVLEQIDSNIDEEGKLSLIDFLKTICDGASRSLGNLNRFEPFIDDSTNTIKIIDQTPLPNKKDILSKLNPTSTTPATIELYGYYKRNIDNVPTSVSSFVRNFGIKTELNSAFASTITIGAQAAGYVVGEDATALSRLNRGLEDRIVPIKIDASDREKIKVANSNLPTPEEKFQTSLKNMWDFMKTLGTLHPIDYNPTTNNQTKSSPEWNESAFNNFPTLMQNFLKYKEAINATTNKAASGNIGFLPISINLTLDGISGIKIYNALNIDISYLPSNYPETMDFIITGVSHKIQNNLWTTDLSTIMVPNQPQSNTDNEMPGDIEAPQTYVSPQTPPPSARNVSRITGPDPALIINSSQVGNEAYDYSPIARNFLNKYKNGYIPLKELVLLKPGTGVPKELRLAPAAAAAFERWVSAMRSKKIPFVISSAYRTYAQQQSLQKTGLAASAGFSPHGWGGAVDFSNLFIGTSNPQSNKEARINNPNYKLIAEIGALYGWYNPWRLSNGGKSDELWHFEYWGPA